MAQNARNSAFGIASCSALRTGVVVLNLVVPAVIPDTTGACAGEKETLVFLSGTSCSRRVVRKYDVADVVESLARRYGLSGQETLEELIDRISDADTTIEARDERLVTVTAPARVHADLSRTLEVWRKSGFDHINAYVTLYSVPCAVVEAVVEGWDKIGDEERRGDSAKRRSLDVVGNHEIRDGGELLPAKAKLLDNKQATDLHRRLRQTLDADRLSHHRIVTCNGRMARITSLEDRFFIVRYFSEEKPPRPTHISVPEGITIDLQPVFERDGTIEVSLRCLMLDVVDVAHFSIGQPTPFAPNEPVDERLIDVPPLEQPILRTTQLQLSSRLRDGQTLVVGGLTKRAGKVDVSARLATVRLERMRH